MVLTWYGGKDNLFRSQNQVNLTWVILLISILYITESDKRLSLSIQFNLHQDSSMPFVLSWDLNLL